MREYTEEYTQESEGNVIFKTTRAFIKNTIKITIEGALAVFTAMGENIVRLREAPSKGSLVTITYSSEEDSSDEVNKRLRSLEEKVAQLSKENALLAEAIEQRVPSRTFRQWLLLMEKNFGRSVLDDSFVMGIQGDSLPIEKLT